MRPGTYNEEGKCWEFRLPWQEYYSVQTTSRILGMGTTQIYSCINRETMEAWRVNEVVRITHDELRDYIRRRGQQHPTSTTEDAVIERVIPKAPRSKRAQGKIQGAPGVPGKVGTVTAAITRGKVAGTLAEALRAQPQNQAQAQTPPLPDPLPAQDSIPDQVPAGGLDLDALNLEDDESIAAVEPSATVAAPAEGPGG